MFYSDAELAALETEEYYAEVLMAWQEEESRDYYDSLLNEHTHDPENCCECGEEHCCCECPVFDAPS